MLKPNQQAFERYDINFYLHESEFNSQIHQKITEKNINLEKEKCINVDFGKFKPFILHDGKWAVL